jgi:hypothetical protein
VGCGGDSADDFCSVGDDIEAVDPTAEDFDNDAFQEALGDAADAAPDEIKEDVETLRDAFEGVDLSDPETIGDPEVIEKFSDPDLQEAGERITAFTKDNC